MGNVASYAVKPLMKYDAASQQRCTLADQPSLMVRLTSVTTYGSDRDTSALERSQSSLRLVLVMNVFAVNLLHRLQFY
jgi:hypothetical protein